MKILIADDDPQMVRALAIMLSARGHQITTARDGAAAVRAAARERPDIVLLDLGMPQLDGIGAIEALRGWTDAPILVLSGRTGSTDKIAALDAGADDYVTKPFEAEELLARLRALARRHDGGADGEPTIRFGDVIVDLSKKTVSRLGADVHLTPTEWRMLELLARDPGALVSRETMLKRMWQSEDLSDTGNLRLYMSQLRRKLEANPSQPVYLLTEQGMGYRLAVG